MEHVTEFIFRVESDSDFAKKYVVDLTPSTPPTCTCVAWVMKKNKTGTGFCKHIARAREWMDAEQASKDIADKEAFDILQARLSLEQTLKELGDGDT